MGKIFFTLVIIFVLLITILLISYINHVVRLRKEDKLFRSWGTIVSVNNHNMHIFIGGNKNSSITLVFLSGYGFCFPTLDFKTLYSFYERDYQIAVVERAGYGYSDISGFSRDINTILKETRQALKKVGVKNKRYILFSHSTSGIESLYWANKYPNEVEAIIGLDMTLPKAYSRMKINFIKLYFLKVFTDLGIFRFFPFVVENLPVMRYGRLTRSEKEKYRVIFYRRAMTVSILNEIKVIKNSAKKVGEIDKVDVPLLLFVSNGKGTGYDKGKWRDFAVKYIEGRKEGEYVFLDCPFYVHNIEYETIYEKSIKFIKSLEE